MKQQSEDQVIPYPKARRFMEEAIRSTHHKPMMHGLLEVDVTNARAHLRDVKARTGESPSFTKAIPTRSTGPRSFPWRARERTSRPRFSKPTASFGSTDVCGLGE
jgi:hypothetical protein